MGGLAVSVRTEPRTTRDVDVAVAVTDDRQAEALVRELRSNGYSLQAAVEQVETGRFATARLEPPGASPLGTVVDLLFATSGIEPEVCERADRLEILAGVWAPVASVGDLIAMKLLSRDDATRPQDAQDLRALLVAAGVDDLAIARGAVAQIESRGFARGRDLTQHLRQAIELYRGPSE